MNLRVDNKIFVSYCAGLTGLICGGLLYNVTNDIYQIYYKKSNNNLKTPNKLDDVKVSSFFNVGGITGSIIGLISGYHGKPLIYILLDNLKK